VASFCCDLLAGAALFVGTRALCCLFQQIMDHIEVLKTEGLEIDGDRVLSAMAHDCSETDSEVAHIGY
jgi:hypothetical protein